MKHKIIKHIKIVLWVLMLGGLLVAGITLRIHANADRKQHHPPNAADVQKMLTKQWVDLGNNVYRRVQHIKTESGVEFDCVTWLINNKQFNQMNTVCDL